MEDLTLTFPYTALDLTEQVNVIPNLYGLVNELNLFPSEGSISTVIEMRYENKVLRVLPAKERGAPGTPMKSEAGKTIFMEIPHFPSLELITPKDLQDILIQVGRTKTPITLEQEVAKRLFNIRNVHAISREWVRSGALQGLIKDGNGATVYDLYATFGITKISIDFDLGNASADMTDKCNQVYQSVTKNLQGETMSGIEVICDTAFFQAFVTHASVTKFYVNAEQALLLAEIVRGKSGGMMWGRQFRFQQILFREYYGTAPIKSGSPLVDSSAPFWAAKTGTAFPRGTMNTFKTYDAPANDLRFVNTPGQEIYVSPKILDHGQGVELKSESNPLAVCRRPEALVQLFSGS
jgi:hypothetical protein